MPPLEIQTFENYELITNDEGQPLELGRGAMGVTYKAFDVDLHCDVTLKVISEKYLGDESARLRFLREARAAAKVRHPNVASVLHLGKTGEQCFYAMEFVEGETLESLIRRSGRLEVDRALEIITQVAAGLAAVHKQGLVHRDIKPSNIMVTEDEGSLVAKIIDLGLAKSAHETPAEAAISTPGAFVGTPQFASPEQFSGTSVDIRSDLYSLGISLWQMLTGNVPFLGSSGEVMSQHQRSPLPIAQLEGVPQAMVALIEVLLEKDPRRRFQTPAELLKAIQTVRDTIDAGWVISAQSLREKPASEFRAVVRKVPVRSGPEKISIARLPVTGSHLFGREEEIAFLNEAWTNRDVNLATIVAWGGVGKSTLVNHWLRDMSARHYDSAELVFGWSFYRQGSGGGTSSAGEFLEAALAWFGDPDPVTGTAWEKGERLARLVGSRRTLLVLDGLEPFQNPPGPQEGRLRELSLQAFLRELAALNEGLCVITTRLPVADIADHEQISARRRDLEHLSNEAGARLLRALGVKGAEGELRSASDEFGGHCLALTLLGSYLTDAYDGDVRFRREVSERLTHDVRQGSHAQRVMESYQNWLGEGPELAVLRLLGLFDRPVGEGVLVEVLLRSPALPGLTESLVNLNPSEWRAILARLRRSRLLAEADSHHQGDLDMHPLVREYFGEQLRSQHPQTWQEGNRRLYFHYRALAPQLPDSVREMEPLFLAVICACNAGLLHEALHEVYVPRIQRGELSFAANVLGARAALLSVLAHFFEAGRWGCPARTHVDGQSLTENDQLYVLIQAAVNITAMRESAPEARICYEQAESLCLSLNHPSLLYVALMGQLRYCVVAGKLAAALPLAKRLYALAQEQNESRLMIGACTAVGGANYYLGDFEAGRHYITLALQTWRSGGKESPFQEVDAQPVGCLSNEALFAWHFAEIAASRASMAEAIALARELKDTHGLAVALGYAAQLAYFERDVQQLERLTSELIELAMRHSFVHWVAVGEVFRGWTRSVSGHATEGVLLIDEGIRDYQATGSVVWMPLLLALRAEALDLAGRTAEALQEITKADALVETTDVRCWCAELHRLRGLFLAKLGADESAIEKALHDAIHSASQQKSISLGKRAEEAYAEYQRQRGEGGAPPSA